MKIFFSRVFFVLLSIAIMGTFAIGARNTFAAWSGAITSLTGGIVNYNDVSYDVTALLNAGNIAVGDLISIYLSDSSSSWSLWSFFITGDMNTGHTMGSPWTGTITGIDFSTYTWQSLYLHAIITDSTGDNTWYISQQIIFVPDIAEIFQAIHDSLSGLSIDNNFDTVTGGNATAFTNLYFAALSWLTELGRITFPNPLDLTDSDTQTLLQNLWSGDVMSMNQWYIKFSPGAMAAMNTWATITMNFGSGFDSISGINSSDWFIVYSSTGVSLNPSDVITGVTATYGGNSWYITFSASHFTDFILRTDPVLFTITSDNAIDSWYATIGDTITVNVIFDDIASSPTLYFFNNTGGIQCTGAGTTWSGSYTITTGTQGEVAISLAAGFPNRGNFTPTYWNDEITDWSAVIFDSVANATISYSPTSTDRTAGSVVATITGDNEIITGLNAISHTFTENGTFEFTFQDSLWNTWSKIATVNWINYSSHGGGGSSTSRDICSNGDTSASYYDGICGTGTSETTTTPWAWSIVWSPYNEEINNAYLRAHQVGITTMPTIQEANIEGNLIRSHMAKMIVNYAVKVLLLKPDTTKTCEFNDIEKETTELQWYMKLACQLWIMGIDMEKFEPNAVVTRAQFWTILSRTLYGNQYNWGEPYYLNHLNALKLNAIMNQIDNAELTPELRGRVMLMMMRADK